MMMRDAQGDVSTTWVIVTSFGDSATQVRQPLTDRGVGGGAS
jgi:hypothetical protein